jgi:pilus assembly protein CpaF
MSGLPNDDPVWGLVQYYLKPILPFFNDPSITEIMVNGCKPVFIKQHGRMVETDVKFPSERDIQTAVIQVGVAIGEEVTEHRHPIVDARLWDGSRFNGILSPWASDGSSITIRVFPEVALSIDDLLEGKSFSRDMLDYLRLAVLTSANLLVSGSTDSGKTTLLNALTAFIPDSDRVVLVEDTKEIRAQLPNMVSLVVFERPSDPNYEPVDLAKMIKTTLRMNASRVIVGEVRDSLAALAFMRSLNLGSNGCMASIHANDPFDAIERLVDLLGEQGKPVEYARRMVCSNLHVIVQAKEIPGVGRKIVEIAEVTREGETISLFYYDYREHRHVVNEDAVNNSFVKRLAYEYGVHI